MSISDWISSCPDSNYLFIIFFLGFLSSMFYDIFNSFCNYILEKAWRVNDLEKIIAQNVKTYDVYSASEKKIVSECILHYERYLFNEERRKRFFDKLKSIFKR